MKDQKRMLQAAIVIYLIVAAVAIFLMLRIGSAEWFGAHLIWIAAGLVVLWFLTVWLLFRFFGRKK